jgi:signal transduction histidine kinase
MSLLRDSQCIAALHLMTDAPDERARYRGRMDTWVRPRPGRADYSRDLGIALLVAVGGGISAALYSRVGMYESPAEVWLTVLVVISYSLPLALRRRFPASVAVIVSLAFFVGGQFNVPEALVTNIALFMAIYSLGAWGRDRRMANIVRAVITVGMFIWIFANIAIISADPDVLPGFSRSGLFSQLAAWSVIQVITNLLYFIGAWAFGNAMWSSARRKAELEARTAELAAEREFSAQQAVALDRVRIARELHDVVAHHVSVMGVQAGAARRVVQSDPAQASTSLEVVERNAREAVDELHRLLTTLRDSDSDPASASASTRGVAQLEQLIAATEGATLHVIGEPTQLSALVGLTVYRIAQEALTNVRKHAGPRAVADVRLRYESEKVELEVTDDGSGLPRRTSSGGLGQLGMRERVDAVGGTLELGRRPRGGYLVRATIPVSR